MELYQTEQISCRPIDTFQQLFNWSKETESHNSRAYKVRELTLAKTASKKQPQLIVCHDMRNNYLDDRYFQGSNSSDDYSFYHWNLIDIFIYFSHHFVTVPPESWINAAHENNVRMLGTFITEWGDGYNICGEILKDEAMIDRCVNKLVEITLYYGFDGWLINVENKVEKPQNLVYFVRKLTETLRAINSDLFKVIWYDSVIETGELTWQNELNKSNECFFDCCDGIFVNYTWKDENLLQCSTYSSRIQDIYIGIDVFGRNCFGGGGFNTCLALEKVSQHNLSCAIFAPGWVHECTQPVSDFIQNNQKYWQLLEDLTQRRELTQLPVITTFTHSRSNTFFVNGQATNTKGWSNFNLQSLMPVLRGSAPVYWCFTDAYYAGSCLLFDCGNTEIKLFDLNIDLPLNKTLVVEYAFKVDSSLGDNKTSDQFKLVLHYKRADSNTMKYFYFESNLSSNEEIAMDEYTVKANSVGWHLKTFQVVIKSDLKLFGLTSVIDATISDKNNLKLGLLRIFETNRDADSEEDVISVEFNILKNFKVFQLKKEMYLGIHLDWSDAKRSHKYYNLFINENVFIREKLEQHAKQSLQYIGTTTSAEFRLGLKMNSNWSHDFKRTDGNTTSTIWFCIYVQCVDSNLHSIVANADNELFDNDPAVIKCLVPLVNFTQQNGEDFSFIKEIIYDLEVFSILRFILV